jgi:hypothetical protein
MHHKDNEMEIENQGHGREDGVNMSTSRANRDAVIEHQIWFCLPGSRHCDSVVLSVVHSHGTLPV